MVQGQKYNRHSVCTVCWMEYGIDTSDNMWKSINDWVGMIERTREILKNTQSVSEIARGLGRSNNTVYKIMGYLNKNKLLSRELSKKFGPTRTCSSDLVQIFRGHLNWEGKLGLLQNSRAILGWNINVLLLFI